MNNFKPHPSKKVKNIVNRLFGKSSALEREKAIVEIKTLST